MSSIGRPLMPPDLLMRSTAICVPTSAVLPPAAAAPESGCSVPTLYGFGRAEAGRPRAGARPQLDSPARAGGGRAVSDQPPARDLAAVPERLTPILRFRFVSHCWFLPGRLQWRRPRAMTTATV